VVLSALLRHFDLDAFSNTLLTVSNLLTFENRIELRERLLVRTFGSATPSYASATLTVTPLAVITLSSNTLTVISTYRSSHRARPFHGLPTFAQVNRC
jgi:hypothetical protein